MSGQLESLPTVYQKYHIYNMCYLYILKTNIGWTLFYSNWIINIRNKKRDV